MIVRRKAWIALAVLLTACSLLAMARPSARARLWDSWRELRLEASKALFLTGKISFRLTPGEGSDVLETSTLGKFMGFELARSRTRSVIDRASGRPLEYTSFSKDSGRHYLFDDEGYTVRKLRAVRGFDAPLEDWTITAERRFAYPRGEDGKPVAVHDYYGMFLALAAAELQRPRDSARFHVATSDGPREFEVTVGEVRTGERSFRNLRQDTRVRQRVRAFRLRVTPTDPEGADEGFLNMEGETELWVEASSKTLLEVSGKVPNVGRVRISLAAIR